MKLAWLTDIHVDFLDDPQRDRFYTNVNAANPDAVLISGDIGTSQNIIDVLRTMEQKLTAPIYFVLGNHDFYHSSIPAVREEVKALCSNSHKLHYLTDRDPMRLSDDTTIIGHDSWADGRFGDYDRSEVLLSDFFMINELSYLSKAERLRMMNSLALEAADYFRISLPSALAMSKTVILLTHVPPFREACWYNGKISDPNFLPHFASKVVGEVLYEIMKGHPENRLIVLCGHTHGSGEAKILDNLIVFTGGAVYGSPALQQIFDLP
jgi:3',5'-cyclic-AMP phosphodiesterase